MAAIFATLLSLASTPSLAWAASFDDPLFFYAPKSGGSVPPPAGDLEDPCGLAVSSNGSIFLSDYYHRAVDVFSPSSEPQKPDPSYSSQPLNARLGPINPHTGPLDDPCGLAFDSTGALYVNDYHREVARFPAPLSLATAQVIDSGDPSDIYANPTGVGVNLTTDHAYVDDRTYIAEHTSDGALVQKIGEGSLQDGYGIAVSGYPATAGYLYVPDAATKTVKVYDPALDTANPIASFTKPGGFGSLVDSAIALDSSTGEIYVSDTIGAQPTESPQAIVYVFNAAGGYEGRLKHATIDSAPVGLAVDNSGGADQSHVYLTSGLGENAGLYGYPAHAATSSSAPPLTSTGGGGQAGPTMSSATISSPVAAAPSLQRSAGPVAGVQSSSGATTRRRVHRRRHRHARHRKRHGGR